MSNHLSHNQFAKRFLGRSTDAELQHIHECPECRSELDRFGGAIGAFRGAVRAHVDDRVNSQGAVVAPAHTQAPATLIFAWRVAFAAGLVVAIVLPFVTYEKQPPKATRNTSTEMSADELMQAIQLHLSRTMPAPMEPILVLLPTNESSPETGGDQ